MAGFQDTTLGGAGRAFPELCEAVAPFTGDDQAPARAAGLLRTWVEGGMIASFHH